MSIAESLELSPDNGVASTHGKLDLEVEQGMFVASDSSLLPNQYKSIHIDV